MTSQYDPKDAAPIIEFLKSKFPDGFVLAGIVTEKNNRNGGTIAILQEAPSHKEILTLYAAFMKIIDSRPGLKEALTAASRESMSVAKTFGGAATTEERAEHEKQQQKFLTDLFNW